MVIRIKVMNDYQIRVIAEHKEIDDRIVKLGEHSKTEEFADLDPDDRKLLVDQTEYMLGYRKVLEKRIDRFS